MNLGTGEVAIVVTLLVQTAALFFAGGKLWQLVRDHDKEITYNETFRHDQVIPRLYQHDERRLAQMLTLTFMLVALAMQAPIQVDPFGQLLTYGTAFVTTGALALAKKYTGVADTKIGKLVKPIQPWLVLGLAAVLPRVIHGTPNVPDAGQLVAAPTATLLAVGAAEVIRRLFPAKP